MKFKYILTALVGTLVAIGSIAYASGVRYNHTPSFDVGFYKIHKADAPWKKEQLVIFCPPDTEPFLFARDRGYISRGTCGGGKFRPMIKRVVGVEGDLVELGIMVKINGETIPNSRVRTRDSEGRPMVAYQGGIVQKAHLFLMSDENDRSYDGRYFGQIHQDRILGYVERL